MSSKSSSSPSKDESKSSSDSKDDEDDAGSGDDSNDEKESGSGGEDGDDEESSNEKDDKSDNESEEDEDEGSEKSDTESSSNGDSSDSSSKSGSRSNSKSTSSTSSKSDKSSKKHSRSSRQNADKPKVPGKTREPPKERYKESKVKDAKKVKPAKQGEPTAKLSKNSKVKLKEEAKKSKGLKVKQNHKDEKAKVKIATNKKASKTFERNNSNEEVFSEFSSSIERFSPEIRDIRQLSRKSESSHAKDSRLNVQRRKEHEKSHCHKHACHGNFGTGSKGFDGLARDFLRNCLVQKMAASKTQPNNDSEFFKGYCVGSQAVKPNMQPPYQPIIISPSQQQQASTTPFAKLHNVLHDDHVIMKSFEMGKNELKVLTYAASDFVTTEDNAECSKSIQNRLASQLGGLWVVVVGRDYGTYLKNQSMAKSQGYAHFSINGKSFFVLRLRK